MRTLGYPRGQQSRDRNPCRHSHRGVRGHRQQGWRDRCEHRRSHRIARWPWRGRGLSDGKGSRCRVGPAIRRQGRTGAERRSRPLACVQGRRDMIPCAHGQCNVAESRTRAHADWDDQPPNTANAGIAKVLALKPKGYNANEAYGVVEHLEGWQVMVLEYVEGETLTDEPIAMGG